MQTKAIILQPMGKMGGESWIFLHRNGTYVAMHESEHDNEGEAAATAAKAYRDWEGRPVWIRAHSLGIGGHYDKGRIIFMNDKEKKIEIQYPGRHDSMAIWFDSTGVETKRELVRATWTGPYR